MANPNEYTFQGDGINATWIPQGRGPDTPDGLLTFSYSDSHQAKEFHGSQTAVTPLPGLGTLVTVALDANDISRTETSFSVLVPAIGVEAGSPQTFRTKGITADQGATLLVRETFPALQTYKVEHLVGTALLAEIAD